MTFISRETLQQRRDLGLGPLGGHTQNEQLLDLSSLPSAALQARLQRLEDLLKALWNHPSDLRILSAIDGLVHIPGKTLRSTDVHEAALFVHLRDRGETAASPERREYQRKAYENLRYLAASKAMA